LASWAVLLPAIAVGQGISGRVASADGNVQFHFAARDGVCGNGKSFLRAEDGGYYTSMGIDGARDECARGPIRVVLVRYGREIVKIETYAGPLAADADDGRDLGAVSTRDAASYLLGLAGSLDGRPARDAMLPAMLADSTVVTPQLLAMSQDVARSRDIRRSAISWLSRRRNEAGGVGAATVARTLEKIVRDRAENESIRQQALSTINGLDRAEGIPSLIQFAGESEEWLSRQAFATLARSGDPRARQFVRDAIKRPNLSEDNLVAAIQGIGGEYAVESDFKMLRDLYPSLNTDRERSAVLSALANGGGSQNSAWLLTIATSATEPVARRRQAVSLLSRFDDPKVKEALKGMVEH
jgi:hypothetical protein